MVQITENPREMWEAIRWDMKVEYGWSDEEFEAFFPFDESWETDGEVEDNFNTAMEYAEEDVKMEEDYQSEDWKETDIDDDEWFDSMDE